MWILITWTCIPMMRIFNINCHYHLIRTSSRKVSCGISRLITYIVQDHGCSLHSCLSTSVFLYCEMIRIRMMIMTLVGTSLKWMTQSVKQLSLLLLLIQSDMHCFWQTRPYYLIYLLFISLDLHVFTSSNIDLIIHSGTATTTTTVPSHQDWIIKW